MHQIFISYKESDRRLANDLAQGLEAAGYTTWNYDRDSRIGFNYMEYCGEFIAFPRKLYRRVFLVSLVFLPFTP